MIDSIIERSPPYKMENAYLKWSAAETRLIRGFRQDCIAFDRMIREKIKFLF